MTMKTKKSYDLWAPSYDEVKNSTRDLSSEATQQWLKNLKVEHSLELGCGTGRNTAMLSEISDNVTAFDFSEGMLKKARARTYTCPVHFQQQDLEQPWNLECRFDLVLCNLVLEHIDKLEHVFREVSKALKSDGQFLLFEYHPQKQLAGGTAKFQLNESWVRLPAFIHSRQEFENAGKSAGLKMIRCQDWFVPGEDVPRVIGFVFTL